MHSTATTRASTRRPLIVQLVQLPATIRNKLYTPTIETKRPAPGLAGLARPSGWVGNDYCYNKWSSNILHISIVVVVHTSFLTLYIKYTYIQLANEWNIHKFLEWPSFESYRFMRRCKNTSLNIVPVSSNIVWPGPRRVGAGRSSPLAILTSRCSSPQLACYTRAIYAHIEFMSMSGAPNFSVKLTTFKKLSAILYFE